MAVVKLMKSSLAPGSQVLWKVESESQTLLSELEDTKEKKAKGLIKTFWFVFC